MPTYCSPSRLIPVERADVREATGLNIEFADDVGETEPPTENEHRLIREE